MRNSQHQHQHERLPHNYDKPFFYMTNTKKYYVKKIKLQNQLSAWLNSFTSFIIPFFCYFSTTSQGCEF